MINVIQIVPALHHVIARHLHAWGVLWWEEEL